MGAGRRLVATSGSAAGAFLIVIWVYVLCVIALQINWSSSRETGNSPQCEDGNQCIVRSPTETTRSSNDAMSPWTRRLFNFLGFSSQATVPRKDTEEIIDTKDCFLRHKLEKAGMPIIHSIFSDSMSSEVIITGVLRHFFDSWHDDSFRCEFQVSDYDHVVTFSDPIVHDFKRFGEEAQYAHVITCPLPKELLGRRHFKMTFSRTSNSSLAYDNITVCQGTIPDAPKYFLTMCTMTKNMDRYIPNWLDYHRLLGVQHVYIYDNSDKSTLSRTGKKYVDSGFLTIIPWAHQHTPNKTYLEVQVASENDCMWRYKHISNWMIKIDVDEFLQPMDPERTKITDYLRDDLDQLGSVRIQNWFFCRHGQINYGLKPLHSTRSIFERNLVRNAMPSSINRGRDKGIARPENVHYYKIHGVKLGGDTITLSPTTEMRLVHYRGDNPRHTGFCSGKRVADFSMIRLWYRLHGVSVIELNRHLERILQLMRSRPTKGNKGNKGEKEYRKKRGMA